MKITCALLGIMTSLPAFADAASTLPSAILIQANWPPYYFAGQIAGERGIGGDIMDLCIPEAGYQPVNAEKPLKRMYSDLEDGTADFNIMSYKKDRESYLYFGKEVLFVESYRPFVRKGSKIVIKEERDFDKLRLGHRRGMQYSPEFLAYINRREKDHTVDTADFDELNIQKLVANRIDVFVSTVETVHWLARKLGRAQDLEELDYTVRTSSYVFSVSRKSRTIKDPRGFLDKFDACVARLKKNGTMEAIYRKYQSKTPVPS